MTSPSPQPPQQKESVSPAPETISTSSLDPILNRTIPGPCHPSNQGTLTWGPDGLVAYGCNSVVVVVDPASVQVLQCLSKHKTPVCQVAWSRHLDNRRLVLASADTSGQIISWDVASGEFVKIVSDGNLEIRDLVWVGDCHLLAVHPPNHLVLWDMMTGAKTWKKSYGDTILGMDVSPFKPDTLLLRCQQSFLLTEFSLEKCPKSDGKKFYMVNNNRHSSVSEGGQRKSRNKLRKMVRSMMLGDVGGDGDGGGGPGGDDGGGDNDSVLAVFHPGVRGQVLIGYTREVIIVDMELGQAVGQINFDRSNSGLVGMRVASQKPVLYLLHESGSVSVWQYKEGLTVASTPMVGMTSSVSMSSMSSVVQDNPLLELTYECLTVSDHIRLAKNCQVSGLCIKPSTQTELCLLTTDGRLMMMSLRPVSQSWDIPQPPILTLSSLSTDQSLKLNVTAVLPALGQAKCIKMCPPLTTKNLASYRPLMAVGTVSGNVQVVNVSTGMVEREVAVHSSPALGLEWTSSNPAVSLLSHTWSTVTGNVSGIVRNELLHVNIITGKVRNVRTDQGKEPGEAKITMVKVSHQRRYFVVAFSQGPFELWDLTKLCVLRTMPRKFPHITALEWSPASGSSGGRSRRSGSVSPVSQTSGEGGHGREYIVMTDSDGQLYQFTVDGHTIKDGTKIPAETGLASVTSICWKMDMIVRGDMEGNVNIWNMKLRQSKNIHTGRGAVKRMAFSPGKHNLKLLVLFDNGVQIWDIKELEMINELRTPLDSGRMEDVDWASSDRIILGGQDGTIKLAGLALAGTSSHCQAYGRHQPVLCPSLLSSVQVARRLATIMYFSQSWKLKSKEDDPVGQLKQMLMSGLTGDNVKIVETLLEYWGDELLEFILNDEVSLSQKLFVISLIFGLEFETELWQLCSDSEDGRSLGRKYHFLADKKTFMARQAELHKLHLSRAASRQDKMRLTVGLMCLGQSEAAVSMLMEADQDTDPSLAMSDQLLACLVQTTSSNNQTDSIMKMVATNFVAEGRVWEGVLLLILIGKVKDAVSYLRSGGYHDQSMVVARCLMDTQEWSQLLVKYADHLIAAGHLESGVIALVAGGQHSQALARLVTAKRTDLAHKLMLMMDNVDREVEEMVMMETVRMMADMEYKQGFDYYCDKMGDKASQILASTEKVNISA